MTRWPLRWTIPGIALVLVLLTELALGAATLALLNRTLVGQVDNRLDEAMTTIENRPGTGGDDPRGLRWPVHVARAGRVVASTRPRRGRRGHDRGSDDAAE